MNKKFEELRLKNKRESNFSKSIDPNQEVDSKFIEETKEFYEECVKPTVKRQYEKLLNIENDESQL